MFKSFQEDMITHWFIPKKMAKGTPQDSSLLDFIILKIAQLVSGNYSALQAPLTAESQYKLSSMCIPYDIDTYN